MRKLHFTQGLRENRLLLLQPPSLPRRGLHVNSHISSHDISTRDGQTALFKNQRYSSPTGYLFSLSPSRLYLPLSAHTLWFKQKLREGPI